MVEFIVIAIPVLHCYIFLPLLRELTKNGRYHTIVAAPSAPANSVWPLRNSSVIYSILLGQNSGEQKQTGLGDVFSRMHGFFLQACHCKHVMRLQLNINTPCHTSNLHITNLHQLCQPTSSITVLVAATAALAI